MGADLSLLQLSFAEADDYAKPLESEISELTQEAEMWACRAMEGRLRSSCCKMIEAQSISQADHTGVFFFSPSNKQISFFLQTVVEFLQL